METNKIQDYLKVLKEKQLVYSQSIELNVLEYCNYIVEVGALTVGTELDGKVIPQNVLCPTLFSKEAVEDIVQLNWKNGNGEKILPVVYKKNDWYREKLNTVEEALEFFESTIKCQNENN